MAEDEDVVGRTFSGEDWYGRDLSGQRFLECTFLDVDLTETTSAGASFESCRFAGARLNASRHEGSGFVRCSFEATSLFDVELVGCKLMGSSFTRCMCRTPRTRMGSNGNFLRSFAHGCLAPAPIIESCAAISISRSANSPKES